MKALWTKYKTNIIVSVISLLVGMFILGPLLTSVAK
jgi:hypothetical protein